MSSTTSPAPLHHGARPMPQGSMPAMALAALGVVFGDIGTSPLYTLKVILALGGGGQDVARATALGSLSLIVWTLVIVATIKYVFVAMRVDNHGEGGIMALMALLGGRKKKAHRDYRLRPVRRGLDLWRRRYHARNLSVVGAGRAVGR